MNLNSYSANRVWTRGTGTQKEYLEDNLLGGLRRNLEQAKAFCKEVGGALPMLKTKQENDFVVSLIEKPASARKAIFLGAVMTVDHNGAKEWVWQDGSKMVYTNWPSSLYPYTNFDAVIFRSELRKWTNAMASTLFQTTVCERPFKLMNNLELRDLVELNNQKLNERISGIKIKTNEMDQKLATMMNLVRNIANKLDL